MKHTNTIMQQYCRAVRKKLPLPARQRRQLLAGLQEELAESAPDCATLDALIAQFGTPDETAQELLSSISPELVEQYRKKRVRIWVLLAALVFTLMAASIAFFLHMEKHQVTYATEHITILPTTDLSGTAPEQKTPEPDPEPAPDADGKQLPLQTLTPQLQTLYESFTAGRAEPIDETKTIYFFADDFDGDGTTDLMILFETKQEDPDVRDANVSIVSGDSHGGNTITLAAGHGWPISDTVTPYLVDRTVYVTLTEADGTLHPYSLTIHRTESGMDYTVCSDENVR